MKNIIKFAVGNPVTICMVVFALLLLGKVSYDQLSVDLLPDLNNPRLFIELKVGERPPEEIEKQFVKNMESMAIRQSDVTQVSSVIKAGTARITVEYTWTKDMDEAFLDLQKAMNPFAQNKEITELKITQHDANLSPVVLVGMSHQNITDMAELRRIAESYIRNELIRLEGVAEVTLSGEEVTTLTVQTDPYKLNAFQLKIEDIASRIESNNQSISGGRVSELGLQYLVKSSSLFSTEADFENLIVGYKPVQQETSGNSSSETVTDVNKAPVFLKEVATVQFVNARPENIVRINGKRSIGLSIYKEMRFNTVKVVDEVTSRLAVIEDALPGYHFQVISNQGIAQIFHMDTDLMGAAGFQVHGYERGFAETFHHVPMRDGLFAGRCHAEAEVGDFGASDRRFDGGFVFFEIALHECVICFDDLMFGELPAHLHVRKIGLAYEHQSRCAHVES